MKKGFVTVSEVNDVVRQKILIASKNIFKEGVFTASKFLYFDHECRVYVVRIEWPNKSDIIAEYTFSIMEEAIDCYNSHYILKYRAKTNWRVYQD